MQLDRVKLSEIMEESAMRTYAYGWDFGNTEIGAVAIVKGKQLRATMPTAFVRVDQDATDSLTAMEDQENENKEAIANRGSKGSGRGGSKGKAATAKVIPISREGATEEDPNKPPVLEPDKVIIQMVNDPLPTAIGHYALKQTGQPWNGRGDSRRYASSYALRGLLATAALLIPDEKEFALFVVAGLPAELYIKHPELRKEMKKALDGKHSFRLNGGETRTITVEVATVVMEGAGALVTYPGLNKTSEAAIIDIGGGTTDLYAQVGAAPITEYCQGQPKAVEAATAILKKTFLSKYRRELTENEARQIMRAFASGSKKDFPDISTFGNAVSAEEQQDLAEAAVKIVAEDIVSFIGQTWKDSIGRLNPILLIGGGTYYFYDAVRNRIEHVKEHSDPVFANPIGYATLAARRLLKKLQAAQATDAAATEQQQTGS
jgi:plasmid segregation protein ParM